MTSLVTRLLGPPEEVEANTCFPNPLRRWMIFANQHFKVYLQRSSNKDLASDFFVYPGALISVGCVNSYVREPTEVLQATPDRMAWILVISKPR
jgi:hypothetical protein